jgi:hypothetical protein
MPAPRTCIARGSLVLSLLWASFVVAYSCVVTGEGQVMRLYMASCVAFCLQLLLVFLVILWPAPRGLRPVRGDALWSIAAVAVYAIGLLWFDISHWVANVIRGG